MKDFLHTFPKRLRELMEARKLNNVQLGQQIGVSHVAIGNFLGGQLPKSEHLFALASHFGVSMEELLGGRAAAEDFLARRDGWRADLAEKTGAAEKFIAGFARRDIKRRLRFIAERQGKLAQEQQVLSKEVTDLVAALEGNYPQPAAGSVLLNEPSDEQISAAATGGLAQIAAQAAIGELGLKQKAPLTSGKTAAPTARAPKAKGAPPNPPTPVPTGRDL